MTLEYLNLSDTTADIKEEPITIKLKNLHGNWNFCNRGIAFHKPIEIGNVIKIPANTEIKPAIDS